MTVILDMLRVLSPFASVLFIAALAWSCRRMRVRCHHAQRMANKWAERAELYRLESEKWFDAWILTQGELTRQGIGRGSGGAGGRWGRTLGADLNRG